MHFAWRQFEKGVLLNIKMVKVWEWQGRCSSQVALPPAFPPVQRAESIACVAQSVPAASVSTVPVRVRAKCLRKRWIRLIVSIFIRPIMFHLLTGIGHVQQVYLTLFGTIGLSADFQRFRDFEQQSNEDTNDVSGPTAREWNLRGDRNPALILGCALTSETVRPTRI
jgi:hypothetical protein